jgi:hypothetical protein
MTSVTTENKDQEVSGVPSVRPIAHPGSGVRTPIMRRAKPTLRVLIRQRTRASAARPEWVLEFEPSAAPVVTPLMGWVGVRVPLGGERLTFATAADALEFAQRHGWSAEIVRPQPLSWSPGDRPPAAAARPVNLSVPELAA